MNRLLVIALGVLALAGCKKSDGMNWTKMPIFNGKATLFVPQPTQKGVDPNDPDNVVESAYFFRFADGNLLKCSMNSNSNGMKPENVVEMAVEVSKSPNGASEIIATRDVKVGGKASKEIESKERSGGRFRRVVIFEHGGNLFMAQAIGTKAFINGPIADKFLTSITLD